MYTSRNMRGFAHAYFWIAAGVSAINTKHNYLQQ